MQGARVSAAIIYTVLLEAGTFQPQYYIYAFFNKPFTADIVARAGVNSDFAIPIPIPIPAFSDFTIPIPIPIPELTIPIPIPIPDLQFQFQFQFRSQGGTNMPRQYIYILLMLD